MTNDEPLDVPLTGEMSSSDEINILGAEAFLQLS